MAWSTSSECRSYFAEAGPWFINDVVLGTVR
jgi:hypothetical protein